MTKLRLSFFCVKPVLCLKAGILFAVLLALLFQAGRFHVVQSLSLSGSGANLLKPATLQKGNVTLPLIEEPAVPHLLAASYYTLEDGMTSTLTLKNKGPQPIIVSVTLFNRNGQSFIAPQTSVPGLSAVDIDLNDWVAVAGQKFRSGNIQATYTGRMMELGAHLRISDPARSLIFDEHFIEDARVSSSSRQEGVFSLPFSSADASLVLTNASDRRISVDGFISGHKQHPLHTELDAHATRVINIPGAIRNPNRPTWGAITLQHAGGEAVLLARMLVQDETRGFSAVAEFSDPGKRKSAQLHGAGMHLALPYGEPLQHTIVARNLGPAAATVQARVRYTKPDNSSGTIELPSLSLAPGEVKVFDTSNPSLYQPNALAAGLELEATGEPGSVIAAAYSMSSTGRQSFNLPLLDPAAQRSSSGGYPWSIDGTSSTIVFIKNTTGTEQKFTGEFTHSGGTYNLGLRKLAAGETLAFDFKALRDNQTPDADGKTIAADATSGNVRWSVHGPANLTLIGRAEQVDTARGMTSSFSCQTCCPERFYDGWITPGTIVCPVGDNFFLAAEQRNIDCYQVVGQPFSLSPFYWSSSNSGVFSVASDGEAEALSTGEAWVQANWDIVIRWYDLAGICQPETGPYTPSTPAQVFDYTVSTSNQTIWPTGTGAPNVTTTTTITVQTGPVMAGQSVNMSLSEVQGAGGHINHTGARPLGTLSVQNGTTDANGRFQATYTSPIFGGEVAVLASVTSAAVNRGVVQGVSVSGLAALGPGNDYVLHHNDNYHPSYHFGAEAARTNLPLIASDYIAQFYPNGQIPQADKLNFNDMSLANGGKFEITHNWNAAASHGEHRVGINCDLRSFNVPQNRRAALTAIFQFRGSPNYLDETGTNSPHWHLRFQ